MEVYIYNGWWLCERWELLITNYKVLFHVNTFASHMHIKWQTSHPAPMVLPCISSAGQHFTFSLRFLMNVFHSMVSDSSQWTLFMGVLMCVGVCHHKTLHPYLCIPTSSPYRLCYKIPVTNQDTFAITSVSTLISSKQGLAPQFQLISIAIRREDNR